MTTSVESRADFLRELWPDGLPDETRLVLWSIRAFDGAREFKDKAERATYSRWVASLDDAPAPPDVDLYYGVCLQPATREGRTPRGLARDAVACPGLYADLDVGEKPKGSKRYPPTLADALRILERMPLQPTVVLLSGGGGLHPYWLWREPWVLDTPAERARCAALVAAWQSLLRREAKDLGGWDVDSTHDLARVLRLPGTTHGRTGELARVHDATPWNRYNPGEAAEHLVLRGIDPEARPRGSAASRGVSVPRATAGALRLDPEATAPGVVVEELRALDAGFDRAWGRRGPDGWSQSEYDLSIATRLLAVGCDDQEVVDALIQHRREGGGPPKLREDYYAATLEVARRRGEAEGAPAEARARTPQAPATRSAEPPASDPGPAANGAEARGGAAEAADPRGAARALVREKLGLELTRVVRYGAATDERGSFRLELSDGRRVPLGGIDALLGQSQLGHRVAEVLRYWPPAVKPAAWRPVGRALLALVEDESVGPQGDLAELMAEWLADWVGGGLPTREEVVSGDSLRTRSHVHEGATWIRMEELGQYLWAQRRERLTAKQLAHMLRAAGWEPAKVRLGARAVNLWRRDGVLGSDDAPE